MPLLTESGNPLLTENGQEFLAEDETGIPGQIGVRGKATLKLAAKGALSGTSHPISLQSRATLQLAAQGALSGITTPVSLQGRATLRLAAQGPISGATGAFDWYGRIPPSQFVPFFLNPTGGPEGGKCFQAGSLPNSGGMSDARFYAPCAGTFTIGYKVSSELNYDWLSAKTETATQYLFHSSGEVGWVTKTAHVEAGEYLEVVYSKDSSTAAGADTGWVTIRFVSDITEIKGQAALRLVSTGKLTGGSLAARDQPLQGRATLQLGVTQAKLLKAKRLQGQATLRLIARNGVLAAPTGLNALMRVISDSARPEVVIDQYLMVWFNGHPSQCEVSLALDEGATFSPVSTWMNPGTTGPAILKIDSAEIPGDGSTHKITVNVRVNSAGQTGPWASTAIYAKTPKARTTDQPEWCEAVRLRQGGTGGSAPLLDLTRIRWRHDGAVKIVARIPVRTSNLMNWTTREIDLGYADYDESEFIAEGVGLILEYLGGQFRNVEFGVCAIDRGNFGPVLWASSPVSIKELDPGYDKEPKDLNPDQKAGTVSTYRYSTFKVSIAVQVKKVIPNWPGNSVGDQIVYTALDKTLLAIKDVVRKGGDVTLDHFCRFEARWNADRTIRNVGFVPSAGFKEGTRQGRIMTDEEAKAA